MRSELIYYLGAGIVADQKNGEERKRDSKEKREKETESDCQLSQHFIMRMSIAHYKIGTTNVETTFFSFAVIQTNETSIWLDIN